MKNTITSNFSRLSTPFPTQAQIDQLTFLNRPENQHLLVQFVQAQQGGQSPTLPKPPGPDLNPYSFTQTRTLTQRQRNQLITCLNSPLFSFVILAADPNGPFVAHLVKITLVAVDFSHYKGWWFDTSDGSMKFSTFFEQYTWGIQC
ncbi:hypothetical protein [Bacillus subtilis]|uniref:hypothetical protein n=1 Tax=Bacillus subtilis TaxID=1423 RepID=UPI003D34827F